MRTPALIFALSAALSPFLTFGPSFAGSLERVHLKLDSPAGVSGTELVVAGSAGRYDRLETAALAADLALFAELAEDSSDFRVMTSSLFLKSEGNGSTNAAGARPVDGLDGATPASRIDDRRAIRFDVSPSGPVAQTAIAACNGLAASERNQTRTLNLNFAIVWRVTTGRFNFKWTNYDRVAPSSDIVNNRDFYSELSEQDAETVIETTVACQPLNGAPHVASSMLQHAKPEAVKDTVKRVTFTPIEPAVDMPKLTAPASIKTASASDQTKPVCDGGMVRDVATGSQPYLCLCPGNTERIATGDNAFACEKRSRKR